MLFASSINVLRISIPSFHFSIISYFLFLISYFLFFAFLVQWSEQLPCKQLIPVRLWGEAYLFKYVSIYSSMDRVSGFDPENVGSNLTKCLLKIEILLVVTGF